MKLHRVKKLTCNEEKLEERTENFFDHMTSEGWTFVAMSPISSATLHGGTPPNITTITVVTVLFVFSKGK